MPTVIDSLIVELGLDPSKISEGRKKAAAEFAGLRDETIKTGKQIEDSSKNASMFISKLRTQVIELFAVFTAGRGIKDFLEDTIAANNALARLAPQLGASVPELSTWEEAGRIIGGSSQSIIGSIQGLVMQFNQYSATGQSAIVPWLQSLGVTIADTNTGKMKDISTILLELAKRFQQIGPMRAAFYGQQIGLSQDMVNLLVLGPNKIRGLLALVQQLGVVQNQDAAAALKLQIAWEGLLISSETLGRNLLTHFEPQLEAIAGDLTELAKWAQTHGPEVNAIFLGLGTAATVLAAALIAPIADILAVAAAIGSVSAAIGFLLEDREQFESGGKSILDWSTIDPELKDVAVNLRDIQKEAGAAWKAMSPFLGVPTGETAVTALNHTLRDLVSLLRVVTDLLSGKFQKAVADTGNSSLPVLAKLISDVATGQYAQVPFDLQLLNVVQGSLDKNLPHVAASPRSGAQTPRGRAALDAWQYAQDTQKKYGIPAEVTFAQWKLESGGGVHLPPGSNNPFGIKAGAGQPYVEAATTEYVNGQAVRVMQKFRKFSSLAEAFDAHARLLATDPRYAAARSHENDPIAFAAALGNYATDPRYTSKLYAAMKGLPTQGSAVNNSSVNQQAHIEKIYIQTNATDAAGISRSIRDTLKNNLFTAQPNYGDW